MVSAHYFDCESVHQLKLGFHPWMSSTEMQNKYAAGSVTGSCPINPTHPQNNANDFSELTGKMTLFPFPVQLVCTPALDVIRET